MFMQSVSLYYRNIKVSRRMDLPMYNQLRINSTSMNDSGVYVYDVYYGTSSASTGSVILHVAARIDSSRVHSTSTTLTKTTRAVSTKQIEILYSTQVNNNSTAANAGENDFLL